MNGTAALLSLHRSSGWLSGTVGMATIARRTWLGGGARLLLKPGAYQLLRAANEQEARGIIANLRGGERAIIIEGGKGTGEPRAIIIEVGRGAVGECSIIIEGSRGGERGIIVEGGRGAQRGIIIEGVRGTQRGFIVEGGRGANGDRAIIIEGGLDWLDALEGGTLQVTG